MFDACGGRRAKRPLHGKGRHGSRVYVARSCPGLALSICMISAMASCQLLKQGLRLQQIAGIETFREPRVDRSEHVACLSVLAVFEILPRKARCSAEFEHLRAFLARCGEARAEPVLSGAVSSIDLQQEFALRAKKFGVLISRASVGREL